MRIRELGTIDRCSFHLEIDGCVSMGGVDRSMAEPMTDRDQIYT